MRPKQDARRQRTSSAKTKRRRDRVPRRETRFDEFSTPVRTAAAEVALRLQFGVAPLDSRSGSSTMYPTRRFYCDFAFSGRRQHELQHTRAAGCIRPESQRRAGSTRFASAGSACGSERPARHRH
ncbi:MAG: hypothetical protein BJ554DRAFT_7290 [Olpidium bornovanus]|uniref:Uncharacterized protein n=1 Tax=Olpidium bornovanus TaxID=278681 RepID=A0A8H7ZW36_9FUNG|nr:MAG: hypothetical protein BJ554DRAFT_7290 [Olpidium bornovanus]